MGATAEHKRLSQRYFRQEIAPQIHVWRGVQGCKLVREIPLILTTGNIELRQELRRH
jgi:hypothetical protein